MGQNSDNRPELLAPAGDFDMLRYAVAGGANAVYLGLNDFNARSKAKNFSVDELRLAVLYCHERGVRVYLALNTLMKDAELDKAAAAAKSARDAGVDGVLVQDFSLLFKVKQLLPDLPVHASTQMGVHNAEGAKFAARLGIDRVVLSREVIPSDIKKIVDGGMETEMFVHGAMCVSFSGNCYFSSVVSGLSGNRGKCLQLCRKRYTLEAGGKRKSGYMLSPKDISMYGALGRLRGLGVRSMKIEGRLRSSEYAYAVSDVYSRALDGKAEDGDGIKLKSVFNRGDFSTAYLDNDNADLIYDKQQNNIGAFVGKVLSVNPLVIGGYMPVPGDGFKFLRNGRETDHAAAGDSAHLTKSGRIAIDAAARVKSDCRARESVTALRSASGNTIDRLINIPYSLPEKCVIIKADEQTDADVISGADIIIYSPTDYNLTKAAAFKKRAAVPVLLDMPIIARGRDVGILREIVNADIFDGCVANNIYALELCREKPVLLGAGMNILSKTPEPKIASIESAVYNAGDIVYAFGRYPLMNFTHSPLRQLGLDDNQGVAATMTDDAGNKFILRKKKVHYFYYELLNAKITNLLSKLDGGKNKRILLDSAGVDKREMLSAIMLLHGMPFDMQRHTCGRFGKGVK